MNIDKLKEQLARIESFKEGYFAAMKWVCDESEREEKEKVADADNKDVTA